MSWDAAWGLSTAAIGSGKCQVHLATLERFFFVPLLVSGSPYKNRRDIRRRAGQKVRGAFVEKVRYDIDVWTSAVAYRICNQTAIIYAVLTSYKFFKGDNAYIDPSF